MSSVTSSSARVSSSASPLKVLVMPSRRMSGRSPRAASEDPLSAVFRRVHQAMNPPFGACVGRRAIGRRQGADRWHRAPREAMIDVLPSAFSVTERTSMAPRRFLPALLLLFVGSGCAALIYEVIWFQLLQLVIGSSAVSMGVLLGTFMGGMCLGSLLLPRVGAARGRHPLRVYATLEVGIGIIALLVLFGMPVISGVYTAWAGSGIVGILLRGVAAGVCLLPPTLLMGATLPAISRWVESTPEGVSWLGVFYGGNIAGGVVGGLLAGVFPLAAHRHG